MKKHLSILLGLGALASALCTTAAAAIVDLTRTLGSAGAYTYYAKGNASFTNLSDDFTVKFYPGYGGTTANANTQDNIARATSGASATAFSSGKLTDGNLNSFVAGWNDIAGTAPGSSLNTASADHDGSFYILFDLGATYTLSDVIITYTNASGQRWSNGVNQNVYTATSFTGSIGDFTLQGSQIFDRSTTGSNITADYTLSSISARYVLLELSGSLSAIGTYNSIGGKLVEVSILGGASPIPEPASVATLAGLAVLLPLALRRRRTSRS
ncbi:MAG TPA: hypothetical protein VIO38_01975 [Rariglobus sp.]